MRLSYVKLSAALFLIIFVGFGASAAGNTHAYSPAQATATMAATQEPLPCTLLPTPTPPATMVATSEAEEHDTNQEKAIVCQVYDLVNAGNLNGLDAFISADLVDHNAATGQAPGLEGFRQSLSTLRTAFPDLNITVSDLVAEGDKVSDRLTIRGTQRGSFLGIPASGRQVTFESMHIYRFDEGKIVEVWHIEDRLGLLQQLPAPTAAATSSVVPVTLPATVPATATLVPTIAPTASA